ncbi:MAG: hypothetical protein CVV44_23420 [Spirochaetae bacterium HGW-Spirochaetae-1]|jgi:ubiquinone/menaquinone biosynthesis C-methylase UbiE|nr:MAG: hypothetical protein CVV44_23420 [Spirochaetae bacterium HGW-Spirochaetae-1]
MERKVNNIENNYSSIAEQISLKIDSLLETIGDSSKREAVKNFWKNDIVEYFLLWHKLGEELTAGTISQDEASEKIIKATDETLYKGDILEESLHDDELVKQLKNIFRITGAPYGLKSNAVRHALVKPGGYPGDYELLEFIYNNVPTSDHLGYCADRTFLADGYARAVNARKDLMKDILKKYLKSRENSDTPVEILNIACGASRDLREMFKEESFNFKSEIKFTLIDKSTDALNFSRENLTGIHKNVNFDFLNHSVYDYLKEPDTYFKMLKNKDIVYSIGLADYIPEEPLKAQTKFFFDLLKPGGLLIIAHKDSKNYHPITPDWWADWTFHMRNEDEVVNIFKSSGINNYSLTIEREKKTNIIFFVIIEKK